MEQLRPESERKGKDSAASISPVLSKTKDGEEEGGVNWNHVFAGALARTLAQVREVAICACCLPDVGGVIHFFSNCEITATPLE